MIPFKPTKKLIFFAQKNLNQLDWIQFFGV